MKKILLILSVISIIGLAEENNYPIQPTDPTIKWDNKDFFNGIIDAGVGGAIGAGIGGAAAGAAGGSVFIPGVGTITGAVGGGAAGAAIGGVSGAIGSAVNYIRNELNGTNAEREKERELLKKLEKEENKKNRYIPNLTIYDEPKIDYSKITNLIIPNENNNNNNTDEYDESGPSIIHKKVY